MQLTGDQRVVQPAKAVIVLRGLAVKRVAAALDLEPGYVGGMLNGRIKPSPKFRRHLAAYLGLPESELFSDAPTDRERVTV